MYSGYKMDFIFRRVFILCIYIAKMYFRRAFISDKSLIENVEATLNDYNIINVRFFYIISIMKNATNNIINDYLLVKQMVQ